jgi:hypothetical protein
MFLIQWVTRLFPEGKSRRFWSQFRAKVTLVWSHSSRPIHAFMAWDIIKYRDHFTFTSPSCSVWTRGQADREVSKSVRHRQNVSSMRLHIQRFAKRTHYKCVTIKFPSALININDNEKLKLLTERSDRTYTVFRMELPTLSSFLHTTMKMGTL